MTTAPTNNQIDQLLAEKGMGWHNQPDDGGVLSWYDENGEYKSEDFDNQPACRFSPTTNRDDLADVLRRLTHDQRIAVTDRLARIKADLPHDSDGFAFWLLTCDPAIIARAVAEVVG